MQAQFKSLQAQVAALNTQLATMINTSKAVDPSGFSRLAKAAEINSRVFRDAAASTGMFQTQQVRVNSATDEYVKKLQAQKLSFREMRAQSKIATAAYKEQLAMQNMLVRKNPSSSLHGKEVFDVTYPNAYAKSLDNAANKMKWFNMQVQAGANQLVNWGKNTQWAGRQLTVGLTMPVAAFGAAAGVMAYQVDKQMTRIAKVYDTTAQRGEDLAGWEAETAQLRKDGMDTATNAAREYQAAITDTLEVQAELAAVGMRGAELQKNTSEVMRISTLGEIDKNLATEAAIALNGIWRQSNEELTESFNYMNSVENATSLTTEDFTTAIPIAGAVVKQFGGDVQELGILMTAMRERGIGAAEGANALKATMQRLGRPSKQVREEFQQMTGKSITDLVDGADNLTEIFTRLNDITKDMGEDKKRDVFAGLFGSYQVTRLMGLTEGMGELQQGIGQVSAAARVAGQDTSEWAKTAQGEIEAIQESVSGQFKAALEELKGIMAEMGVPFLKAATTILQTLAKIGNWINDLPDGVKFFGGWAIALAAVAGPAIMLVGLLANLGGMAMKMGAGVTSGFLKMANTVGFADKETRIYNAAVRMSQTENQKLAMAVKDLTAHTEAQTAAQIAANTASKEAAIAMGQELRWTERASAAHKKRVAQLDLEQRMMQHYGRIGPRGGVSLIDPATGGKISKTKAMEGIQHVGRVTDVAQAQTQAYAIQQRMTDAANEEAKARARSAAQMKLGALSAAAMSVSMGATMMTSNKTAESVLKWTMIGSIVVPAVATLSGLMKGLVVTSGLYAKNMWQAALASRASGGSLLAGGAKKLVSGLGVLVTRTNIWGAAIAAVGYGLYKAWEHGKKAREEVKKTIANQASLAGQTERWADATGKALDGYKQFTAIKRRNDDQEEFDSAVSFYKSDEEKEGTAAFNDMSFDEQNIHLMTMYIDMVRDAGLTAKEAEVQMAGFFRATGMGATEAYAQAKSFVSMMGEVSNTEILSNYNNIKDKMANEVTNIYTLYDKEDFAEMGYDKEYSEMGKNAGRMWQEAFLQSTRDGKKQMIEDLKNTVVEPWNKILSDASPERVEAFRKGIQATLQKSGMSELMAQGQSYVAVSSGEALHDYYVGLSPERRELMASNGVFDEKAIQGAEALERYLVGGAAAAGQMGAGVDLLTEYLGEMALMLETMTLKELQGEVTGFLDDAMGISSMAGVTASEFDAMWKAAQGEGGAAAEAANNMNTLVYAIAENRGIKVGASLYETLQNVLNGVKVEAKDTEEKVKNLGNALSQLPNVKVGLQVQIDIMKAGWEQVMQGTADVFNDDFDERMQAASDRTSSYWDGRKSALDAEMERRSAGLDAKWEKRKAGAEKYWDARLKAVEDAIAAEEKAEERRQKIFEAEMERMDKLSDAANKNIDFNIALNSGDLDEAAKIQNDIQADSARSVLEDAAAASQNVSDKKVGRLDKKSEDLEAQRDAAMAAMDKREQAEKAHLDKISDMRKKALEADAEAAIKANQEDWERKKEAHDASIELLLSGVARNEKELKKMIEAAGLDYDVFRQELKDKGLEVNQFIGKTLDQEVRKAGNRLRTDSVWSDLGKDAMKLMITSMGFKSVAQFKHFIKTGEMKDLLDEPNAAGKKNKGSSGRHDDTDPLPDRVMHTGGWAGKNGGDSRRGVPRTYRGLHPSEVMIKAQKGEFVVNKDAAEEHGPLLETLNSGGKFPYNRATARGKRGAEGGGGMAGVMAGAIMRSVMFGVMKNVDNKYETAKAAAAAAAASTGAFPGKYIPGVGGWQRPSIPGLGWSNSHDYRAAEGTPIFAPSDGVITRSMAITSGGSPGNGKYATPYRSYGETIQIRMADGNVMNFGHLMPGGRYVSAGQKVKGGALIGRSGNTGNSTGPHLHMDIGGNENASGYLASRGIPLKAGAREIMVDDLPARLHKGEGVYTKPLNEKIHQGIENFANGQPVVYDIDINGEGLETREIVREVIREIDKRDGRRPVSRTIGNGRTR